MQIFYDITLIDDERHISISYWADSFSVDEYRVLNVKSRSCGDVCVEIPLNERLVVRVVIIDDGF